MDLTQQLNILIITDQPLKIENNRVFGSSNFTNILHRLQVLGKIKACLPRPLTGKNSIVVYNDDITNIIAPEDITYIKKSNIKTPNTITRILTKEIEKADIVFCYIPSVNGEKAARIASKLNKKVFSFLVACTWDGLWNQDLKRKIAAPYRFFINRYVMKHSDYAMYVTNEFLQHRYPSDCKQIGISDVVLNSIDNQVLENRLTKIKNLGTDTDIHIATTAMLNVPYKGQRYVIQALKLLKDHGITNIKYHLIGGGDNSSLLNEATNLGVTDQVVFEGKLPHNKVFELLDKMDIYVHPSLQEGLPRSVVEAMSRALPCIGAKTGAIPELLQPEFVFKRKSAKAIAELLKTMMSDKDLLAEQATRNFDKAKEYECNVLDERRNQFFDSIKADFK